MLNFISHWLKSKGETSRGKLEGSADDEIFINLLTLVLGAEVEAGAGVLGPAAGANAASAVLRSAA